MCISPITIPNPNKGLTRIGYGYLKDCTSAFIRIPCGVCPECVANKQMQLVQRAQMESQKNYFFFCTLTYNEDMIPKHTCSSGVTIRYADVSDLQNMIKRLRKLNAFGRPFRYLAVSERGHSGGRPHFHVIFLVPKYDDDDFGDILNLESLMFSSVLDNWSRNVALNANGKPNTRNPKYVPLCTYVRRFSHGRVRSNYDLHYVNPLHSKNGVSDVSWYVLKYMLKASEKEEKLRVALWYNLPEDEYNDVWRLVRSRMIKSLGFGLNSKLVNSKLIPDPEIVDYLKNCVQRSKSSFNYPCYYSKDTLDTFPLSRFYKANGNIFNIDDAHDFFFKNDNGFVDGSFLDDSPDDINQLYSSLRKHSRIVEKVSKSGDSLDFDDLVNK